MRKKKWLLPVCIAFGIVVLLLTALLITAAVAGAKGYDVSVGNLYFGENTVFLVKNGTSMMVSDRSKNHDLFSGYTGGDKVLLVHGGVEEIFPARTGGYHVFCISKGDGTYKPDADVLGIAVTNSREDDAVSASPVRFEAQYIRTGGHPEGVKYPVVKIIRSVDELNSYYEANKDIYYLERRNEVYSDTTIGFLDACDKYDASYFEDRILVMVLLEEPSGSIRHTVDNVKVGSDGKLYVGIHRDVPEAGTCDMAQWHILIEPEKDVDVASGTDVIVYLDGVNPRTQPTTVRESGAYSNIALTVPYDWNYETERGYNNGEYCISFWPADQAEGKIKMWYYTAFGVCGTGLKEEEITVGEYKARKGTYDNKTVCDFISFSDVPGSYVAMNEGADKWWSQYGDEAMRVLGSVKIAEGILTEQQAIDLAKKEVSVKYDRASARFDSENGLWIVSFSKKTTTGENQVFAITHEGKIVDVKYVE